MADNPYASARNHSEVLPLLNKNPGQIARSLAEYDERTRDVAQRWFGRSGGYYEILPGDDKIMTDRYDDMTGEQVELGLL